MVTIDLLLKYLKDNIDQEFLDAYITYYEMDNSVIIIDYNYNYYNVQFQDKLSINLLDYITWIYNQK